MRSRDAYCSTCFYFREGCQQVPVLGLCCPDCIERLSRPMTHELCVQGESVLSLCELYEIEFKSRAESLRKKARQVIERISCASEIVARLRPETA